MPCSIGTKHFCPVIMDVQEAERSSEAEVIALDTALRTEGIPALTLWDRITDFRCPTNNAGNTLTKHSPEPTGRAKLFILEDNDAVIKMGIKGRSPALRHKSRTHRVDLDWLFERIRDDQAINMPYVETKSQIDDFLTKGQLPCFNGKCLLSSPKAFPTKVNTTVNTVT